MYDYDYEGNKNRVPLYRGTPWRREPFPHEAEAEIGNHPRFRNTLPLTF
jgi:hypothetical protein